MGVMRRARAAVGSLIFFLVAPCVVAGLVPYRLTGWQSASSADAWLPVRWAGLVMLIVAVGILVSAFVRFVVEGIGTPAPVAPTERLVVGGLYRYVRNPMYLAVIGSIVGQAMLLLQPILLGYAVVAFAAMAAFVRWYEEPTLRERFGPSYVDYCRAVRGWWPRRQPYADGH
jgi:protein-S-isoprenylcysteine O-methyltransferase Ste14